MATPIWLAGLACGQKPRTFPTHRWWRCLSPRASWRLCWDGLSGFMGIAICLLAMLKLMDVKAFAASFRKYDLLSQRWRPWGRLYPGIELLVGLGVLLQPQPTAAAQLVGALAVLLGAMGMVSVGKALLIDHLALNCACVGGNSKTPLGVVSFAENLIMAMMGAVMLFS